MFSISFRLIPISDWEPSNVGDQGGRQVQRQDFPRAFRQAGRRAASPGRFDKEDGPMWSEQWYIDNIAFDIS